MKTEYEEPKLEIIYFENADIVTASGDPEEGDPIVP